MKRRDFLKTALAAGAGAALPLPCLAAAEPLSAVRLTILHTNDVHSHLEPYEGLGGAPARQTFIEEMRRRHRNTLLFDSGDIFQGTPYFNLFHGEPEILCMNAHKYNAATIGNHDFDAGIERLAELARDTAEFPFLNSNYDFTNTPMNGLTKEYIIREIEGLRVGIFGLGIKLEGLVPKDAYGETRYLDPINEGRRVAHALRHDERCHFIICLSHINLRGFENPDATEPGDRDIISRIPEVDLVLGGHNHILMEEPEVIERSDNAGWIQQTGWAGTHVGVLHFDVYGSGKRELV